MPSLQQSRSLLQVFTLCPQVQVREDQWDRVPIPGGLVNVKSNLITGSMMSDRKSSVIKKSSLIISSV